MTELNDIPRILSGYQPRRIPGRRWMTRCGVAVLLDEHPEEGVRVLFMRRAKRPGDPWSGDMSFPGGRMSRADISPMHTAIRETAEEVGIRITEDDALGRMSDVMTRKHEHWRPMVVTPQVFRLTSVSDFRLNHEAVDVVQVPLAFFAERSNRQKMHWQTGRVTWQMPCFYYGEYRIWGLTLYMLRELVQLAYGTGWRAMRMRFGKVEGDVVRRKP